MIEQASKWVDFELLDAGNGEKLERWGEYLLRRPDPQAIWDRDPKLTKKWETPDLFYHRSATGGGTWEARKNIPSEWQINYNNLTFNIKPTAFKHTGVFPEQAVNWEWIGKKVQEAKAKSNAKIRVLNLFAYTGGASLAAAAAGAEICHIDASAGMNAIAKRNFHASQLEGQHVRIITEDAVKFVEREFRRGSRYDAIIMDPPVYGRGPSGQLWELERALTDFVRLTTRILTDHPLFFLINAYATTFSSQALANILTLELSNKYGGAITFGELGLPLSSRELVLPCGLFARWSQT